MEKTLEMERLVMQALLYDFYGQLLNEHQRAVYEDYIFEDISLSEIAKERGISRQGVHDLIKRCGNILQEYEDKLHLVEKFQRTKQMVAEINEMSEHFGEGRDSEIIADIKRLSGHIIDEM